ncbi:carboxymuconolactone decarboxylase family protein [Rhodococcus rhodochrous]|uniref:Carboxymuconolactone decarboxylase family protein n=1 Tax=Rhodococcus rhodochrous TaxID=1829 RepID=A0AAW4XGA3_RHORH|nr:carboxymuconolactone decarboxylase family protein [Rhodococcus rhodochrous]MCD2111730.1 carboxymuconolactone decarboxylase family protein [Rhodococcus rhodochrous]
MTTQVALDDAVQAAHRTVLDSGLAVRREVLGDEYVDAALSRNAGTDGEGLQEYVSEFVWGGVWTRDGLERRDRSLVTISLLIALGQHTELATHVRTGIRNRLSRREISEAVVHATAYVGCPAGIAAMRVVQQVLVEELGPLQADETMEEDA